MSRLEPGPFKELIKNRCGLHFEAANEQNLLRALQERLSSLALTPEAYLNRLFLQPEAFQELVDRLTINETYFFRESEQIALLVDHLVPRFLQRRNETAPVRILSAGCSSGEEPYSLVMALLERHGASIESRIHVMGCDIDSTVLAKARRGCYSEFSFRGVSPTLRDRYFQPEPTGGFRLEERVARQVTFHPCNLLSDSLAAGLGAIDILLFRNVSIYFDPPTRRIILGKLATLLHDEGILMLGISETLANDLGVLRLVEEQGYYYFVKDSAPAHSVPFPASSRPLPAVASAEMVSMSAPLLPPPPPAQAPAQASARASAQPESSRFLEEVRQLLKEKRYDEALIRLDSLLAQQPDHLAAQLLKAHSWLLRKEYQTAATLAHEVLARDSQSIDALILLGLSAKWRQQPTEAIEWFRQAVYWRHGCWPAHYYLADLYRHNGEMERARHGYRVVMQLLSGPIKDCGIHHLDLEMPMDEIRFLCEYQLARIGGV
ncbi:MAG: chemotaxis protein CheR [Magnetococcales bacterium]|nr:chemotaxis protein CheR [Magnetococcales bacterium]